MCRLLPPHGSTVTLAPLQIGCEALAPTESGAEAAAPLAAAPLAATAAPALRALLSPVGLLGHLAGAGAPEPFRSPCPPPRGRTPHARF